jgi:ABC-type antimicrobial peptide transport system permease subunit
MNAKIAMLAEPREFMTTLLGGYAGLALLLASIGIFGVISYAVTERTAEIGIRVALGACPRDVAALILRQGLAITIAGVAIGAGGAAWLSQYLKAQLYSVSPLDTTVYAMVAVALATVAICACLIPVRRAVRVDPVIALRHE